jgi:outer membrane protein TolC
MLNRIIIALSAILIIVLISPIVTYALTMDEAIGLALKNNHRIKEYMNLSEAQESRVGSEWSAFWPRLDVQYDYEHRKNTFASFQTEEASTFTAGASYNLFNGFRDVMELRSSQSTLDAAKYEEKAIEEDVILDVKRAYINVLRSSENLKANQDAVQLLERQRRDAELFYKSGLTAKNELLKVEVELASAKQDLLRNDRNLEIAVKTLARRIGIDIDDNEELVYMGYPQEIMPEEEALKNMMIERRSELKYLRSLVKAKQYTRDSAYIYNRFGEDNAFEGRDDPLFDDDERVMVTASWNLFEGFKTRHDVNAEDAESRALEEKLKDTEQELDLRLKAAIAEYNVSLNRVEVAKKAVEQAEENYRITDNQFKQRVATSMDLLDARFFLTRAQTDHNNSISNLHLAIAVIERMIEVRNMNGISQIPEDPSED